MRMIIKNVIKIKERCYLRSLLNVKVKRIADRFPFGTFHAAFNKFVVDSIFDEDS